MTTGDIPGPWVPSPSPHPRLLSALEGLEVVFRAHLDRLRGTGAPWPPRPGGPSAPGGPTAPPR